MITHRSQPSSSARPVRDRARGRSWGRAVRRTLTGLVSGLVMVLAAPLAAMAEPPSDWPNAPHVSGLQFLVVLFLIPLGLAVVISVLTVLPSMIRDKGYEPGQAWRSEAEWFGGPRQGVDAEKAGQIEQGTPESAEGEQGGTSARW